MADYLGFDPTSEEEYFFVSYNSDDSERLTTVTTTLNERGVPLWYDYGLEYGDEEWRIQIGERIEDSLGVILFITKDLFSRPDTYVKTEYRIAKDRCRKPIYIVLMEVIDDTEIPYSMYDWWLEITDAHCLQGWKYQDLDGLVREICRMLDRTVQNATSEARRTHGKIRTAPGASDNRIGSASGAPAASNSGSSAASDTVLSGFPGASAAAHSESAGASNALQGSDLGIPGNEHSRYDSDRDFTGNRRDEYKASEMLIKLEDSYQNNSRHIFLFHELEKEARKVEYKARFTDDPSDKTCISLCDVILYFTFFESLYRVIRNGLLTIEDVDDCFADRFFKFIHHPFIQEHELYIVSSTYANIFELYAIWKKYHVSNLTSPSQIAEFLKNEIPDFYLNNKTYAKECWSIESRSLLEKRFETVNLQHKASGGRYRQFHMRRLFPSDVKDIIMLQNHIIKNLPDDRWFVESTKQELLESMLIDFCYGLYDGEELAAMCLIVLNRETDRNLLTELSDPDADAYVNAAGGSGMLREEAIRGTVGGNGYIHGSYQKDELTYIDCLTFDTIQVRGSYRGYGIHSFFLSVADTLADMVNARSIIASVYPENRYSKRNFLDHGYKVRLTKRIEHGVYNCKERDIVVKMLDDKADTDRSVK